MIFDCDEPLRRAVKIRAAETGKTPSVVISEILQAELASEIERAKKTLAAEERRKKSD